MKQRYYFLDGLKGIATLFVIITHYSWTRDQRIAMLFPFWIGMAVPLFIFVSGFVNAASFDKHNIDCFEKAYELKSLINKLLRYSIPFFILILFEYIWDERYHTGEIVDTINLILNGGTGPGGYYFTFMIQLVFLFPAIYFIIKKHQKRGLFICLFINFMYELTANAYHMSYPCYSQYIFRYTFLIAFGAFMYLKKENLKITTYIMAFLVGVCFLIAHDYLGYQAVIFTQWSSTSLVAIVYILPFLGLCTTKLQSVRLPFLEWIGKRSYDIFLIQMFFYEYFERTVSRFVTNDYLCVLLCLFICVSAGSLIHNVQTKITDKLSKRAIKTVATIENNSHTN